MSSPICNIVDSAVNIADSADIYSYPIMSSPICKK